MEPVELDAALAELGWSDWELSRRLRCHRSLPGKWRKKGAKMPAPVARWLRASAAAITSLPPPDRADWGDA